MDMFNLVKLTNSEVVDAAVVAALEAAVLLGYEVESVELPVIRAMEIGEYRSGFQAAFDYRKNEIIVMSWLPLPRNMAVGLLAHEFLHAIQYSNNAIDLRGGVPTGTAYVNSRHEKEAYGLFVAIKECGVEGRAWEPMFLAARKGQCKEYNRFMSNMASMAIIPEAALNFVNPHAAMIKELIKNKEVTMLLKAATLGDLWYRGFKTVKAASKAEKGRTYRF